MVIKHIIIASPYEEYHWRGTNCPAGAALFLIQAPPDIDFSGTLKYIYWTLKEEH